ncbi:hypothetical protein [Bradyrhizobium murdochi]|uniref:hypothetical protein n=1 Tax=Bradyrhizobium murdochi TaxID=1038859 RepID=UPI0003FC5C98|nr:hypothetical protein [Bradyrhizobium murdochi]
MLMNTEQLAENYRHVSAYTLINALAFPIENVKGGFIIVKPFRAIARPIAGWLLNIIFDQGEKLHRRFLGNRGEDQPTTFATCGRGTNRRAACLKDVGRRGRPSSGLRSNHRQPAAE